VVHEVAKGHAAKLLVRPRMKDELVPQVIRHLGRHADEFAPAFQVRQEELAQALRNQLAILLAQVGMLLAQLLEQPQRQNEVAYASLAPQLPLRSPKEEKNSSQHSANHVGEEFHRIDLGEVR
jgi:hypothetical protein